MHRNTAQSAGQTIGWMGGLQVIGMDIAKNVFQLHTVTWALARSSTCSSSGPRF